MVFQKGRVLAQDGYESHRVLTGEEAVTGAITLPLGVYQRFDVWSASKT